jgi:DNA-directed RNA polymerase specialized sigma24 family protein
LGRSFRGARLNEMPYDEIAAALGISLAAA